MNTILKETYSNKKKTVVAFQDMISTFVNTRHIIRTRRSPGPEKWANVVIYKQYYEDKSFEGNLLHQGS